MGLWAAAAFAQTGNFPSSTVAARRTFVRVGKQDGETAALLAAVAPLLALELRAASPFAAKLSRFLRSGDGRDEIAARKSWDEIARNASKKYPPALWQLAGRSLDAALSLATVRVLARCDAKWPDNFEEKLAQAVPTLLPPQARALQNGNWGQDGNAVVALSPGSGKTLLGELFLASALAQCAPESARWAVFMVPYVALGRGVMRAARLHFPDGVQVHSWLGNAREEDDGFDLSAGGTHLVIATPERLDAHLRRHPNSWRSLCGVVCDEAHLIGEGERGARLEGLLSRLKVAHAGKSAPRLLLFVGGAGRFHRVSALDWGASHRFQPFRAHRSSFCALEKRWALAMARRTRQKWREGFGRRLFGPVAPAVARDRKLASNAAPRDRRTRKCGTTGPSFLAGARRADSMFVRYAPCEPRTRACDERKMARDH
jgi:helicase